MHADKNGTVAVAAAVSSAAPAAAVSAAVAANLVVFGSVALC